MSEENLGLVNAPEAEPITPATSEVVNTEPEIQSEEPKAQEQDKGDQLPKGIERRFAKMTKEKYSMQSKIDELEATLKAQKEAAAPTKSREEYTDDEWLEHLAEKKAQDYFNKKEQESKAELTKKEQAAQKSEVWAKRVDSFKEELPDFVEVVGSADIELPVDVLEQISESDIGPKLAYHLAQNPTEADALQDMSERQRDRFLTRLEVKLETKSFKKEPAEITKAAPTPQAKGRGSSSTSMENMSVDDWMKARRAQVYGKN